MTTLEIISRLCGITTELSEIVRKQQETIERSKVEEAVKEELRQMVDGQKGNWMSWSIICGESLTPTTLRRSERSRR